MAKGDIKEQVDKDIQEKQTNSFNSAQRRMFTNDKQPLCATSRTLYLTSCVGEFLMPITN